MNMTFWFDKLYTSVTEWEYSRDHHETRCSVEDFNSRAESVRKCFDHPKAGNCDWPQWKRDLGHQLMGAVELAFNQARNEVRWGNATHGVRPASRLARNLLVQLKELDKA
jgi:hypothetical protein